ncbi:hypothetical protein [Halobacteriovorax sp. HLS]|uniref:hypothetical protein n=1 Tax=Halobacteriovorax sp. HLS TaxID=2234000 RepID=UPI000FD77064|nr:hypothetical protein [Halobacteriovorax sp. HLS]
MSDKLSINIKTENEAVIVLFKGPIDEDSNFDEISKITGTTVTFDFNEVTLINSCGIREWVNFIEKLDSSTTFSYINCRQIVIEQINMVKGFIREGARVDSFYAPYYCEGCDQEFKIHLKYTDVTNQEAPSVKCTNCEDTELEFDAIEAQYFQFIK